MHIFFTCLVKIVKTAKPSNARGASIALMTKTLCGYQLLIRGQEAHGSRHSDTSKAVEDQCRLCSRAASFFFSKPFLASYLAVHMSFREVLAVGRMAIRWYSLHNVSSRNQC
jgi:hypothetical protein